MIRRISLATDLSAGSERAFRTALALAVFYRASLEILHVSSADAPWRDFPQVRGTLEAWGLLPPQSRPEDVYARLGVGIGKVEIAGEDATSGICGYVEQHRPDLLVAASQGRTGLGGWLSGSVAMETLRATALPTLLLGPSAGTFIDEATGAVDLRHVLCPVAASPSPVATVQLLRQMLGNSPARSHYLHVEDGGGGGPQLARIFPGLEERAGPVVPAILDAARDTRAQLIVMPTAIRHGIMGALKGSVTQRVLHDAPCPILALPS